MEIERRMAGVSVKGERIYIAAIVLANFHGKEHVEVQLFRPVIDKNELDKIRGAGYVGKPDPDMPKQLLEGATEDAALECIMESFTIEETLKLEEYLKERYGEQIEKMTICPIELPVPLGVGPLGAIPESSSSGFINFEKAPDYPLDFPLKGYYDLAN